MFSLYINDRINLILHNNFLVKRSDENVQDHSMCDGLSRVCDDKDSKKTLITFWRFVSTLSTNFSVN